MGFERCKEQGLKEGMEKGIEKGKEQGLKEGIEKGIKEVAHKLLKQGMPIANISQVTGLTEEEIQRLIV